MEPDRPGALHADVRNEQVLSRQLSALQQSMMALGGAIGTGLFLASGLAVNVAGPAIILSYVLVACISLLLASALTEMAVANPTAGAFGVYAGMYVSPFAGYAVRVSYWLMEVVATGGQLVAASIYMGFWFPGVPGAVWVLLFAVALIFTNSRAVGQLGIVESWLVLVKIIAVGLFVAVAAFAVLGLTGDAPIGLRNLTSHGGFMPFGVSGVWLGCAFVIYSFIGVEIVGVTSGEASDPSRTIPVAMRRMVVGLSAIYVVTIALLVALRPWNELGVGESPFVSVLRRVHLPGAAGIMNFVVLTAALSSANANLYLMVRTMFSLARAGFIPRSYGAVTGRGTPRAALLVSSAGLGVAVLVQAFWPASAYVWFFGVALFGGLFVWLMIFVTHIAFRASNLTPGLTPGLAPGAPIPRSTPWGSCVGAVFIAAILASTWWLPDLRATLMAGGPWLLALAVGYRLSRSAAKLTPGAPTPRSTA